MRQALPRQQAVVARRIVAGDADPQAVGRAIDGREAHIVDIEGDRVRRERLADDPEELRVARQDAGTGVGPLVAVAAHLPPADAPGTHQAQPHITSLAGHSNEPTRPRRFEPHLGRLRAVVERWGLDRADRGQPRVAGPAHEPRLELAGRVKLVQADTRLDHPVALGSGGAQLGGIVDRLRAVPMVEGLLALGDADPQPPGLVRERGRGPLDRHAPLPARVERTRVEPLFPSLRPHRPDSGEYCGNGPRETHPSTPPKQQRARAGAVRRRPSAS